MSAIVRLGSRVVVCTLLAGSCAEPADDAREAEIVVALVSADQHLARSRPRLLAGKYEQMAADPYSFYRGTFPLFLHDVRSGGLSLSRSAFEPTGPLPLGLGDAHPENFGTLRAADGSLALEPNDLDSADRWPATWDLRRLAIGLVLFARLANADDEDARASSAAAGADVARAAAASYANAFVDVAPIGRIDDGGGAAALVDLFERAHEDAQSRDELAQLTVVEDGRRRLVRGAIDPAEPWSVLTDLPSFAGDALDDVLARYRSTLVDPPAPSFFRVLDAARQLGSGVASWPRVRALVLVAGPTDAIDDDVILELKELAPSGAGGWIPPGVSANDEAARVLSAVRHVWAEPDADPLWGTSSWLGLPVQIRTESEAHKTLRVARMEGDLGTPEALIDLATVLGALLARIHHRDARGSEGAAAGIASAIRRDPDAFVAEQVAVALEGADGVPSDWTRFRSALARLGPTLGVAPDDTSSPDLAALFGDPPDVTARSR